jgi:hypothetical protein
MHLKRSVKGEAEFQTPMVGHRFRLGSRVLLSGILFLITPILFVVSVAQLTKAKGPQWLPYTFEYSYFYLLNSVLLLEGKEPMSVQHPGTTTMAFGATILRTSTLQSNDDLVEHTLRNPEKQIKKLHRALLIFTAVIVWIAPWATALALRSYIAGLLIQAPVLFFQTVLYWGILFSSELINVGFSVAVVCGCVLLLLPSTVSEKRIILGIAERTTIPGSPPLLRIPFVALITGLVFTFGVIIWGIVFGPELINVGLCIVAACCCAILILASNFSEKTLTFGLAEKSAMRGSPHLLRIPFVACMTGLLCAFGGASKTVFFPLILISLFGCRSPRNLAAFTAFFVLGLALALAPIHSKLQQIMSWSWNVGIHSGEPATSTVGLPHIAEYLQSLRDCFQEDSLLVIIPSVVAVVAIVLSVLGKGHKSTQKVSWWTVLGVFGLQLLSFFFIAKTDTPRYLMPLCLSVGLNLVLLFYAVETTRSVTKRVIASLPLIGLLFLGFKDFVELTPETYKVLRGEQIEQVRLYKHAREITKNDVRLDYYFSDSPEYPLFIANEEVGGAFSSLLTRLYPNAPIFINYNTNELQTFSKTLDTEVELQKHDHLYFLGGPSNMPKLDGLDQGTFETIDRVGDYSGDYSLDKWTRK